MKKTLILVYAYPKNRFPASHFFWLAEWQAKCPGGIWFQAKVNGNLVCTKNQVMEFCLNDPSAKRFDEFVFVDQDTIYLNAETDKFWDSDADVVCCEADMQDPEAWNHEQAFHDSFWRVKRKVLDAMRPPYFFFQYNGRMTKQSKCICRSFSDQARELGFTVERSGKCGHAHEETWVTSGCCMR